MVRVIKSQVRVRLPRVKVTVNVRVKVRARLACLLDSTIQSTCLVNWSSVVFN